METINARDESGSGYAFSNSEYFWYVRDNVSMALEYGYPLSLNLDVRSNFSVENSFTDYQRKN